MKKTVPICFLLSLLMALTTAFSASAEDGARLYVHKFCTTCHGHNGIAYAPNYPNLAKQDALYLLNQVKDIIAKKRANKLTLLMSEHPVVMEMTEKEIAAIAAHLNTLKFK